MDIAAEICAKLAGDWLPAIYRDRIRPQRTRAYHLDIAEREHQADIQYTLLGIELKIGKQRLACPDLAMARYLRIFARMGCRDIAIPYDITRISAAADELETAWQRSLLLFDEMTRSRPSRSISQMRSQLIKSMRIEITQTGAGDAMPRFDRPTRQRET